MRNTIFLKLSILFALVASIASTANAVGVLDKTFGTNGTITTVIGTNTQITATKVRPDGKILILGTLGSGATQDTVLVRYNQNGSLDAGFGNNGIVVLAFSPFYEMAHDLSLQSDGKLLLREIFILLLRNQ
jgi:uncharacterized delta-60 repeat protein